MAESADPAHRPADQRSSAIAELAREFPDGRGFLNTASLGLPSLRGLDALRAHLDAWSAGRSDPPEFDDDVERSRAAYASLVGTRTEEIAIIGQVSIATGLVASSLPDGARVLCAQEDFTSVLFPFLADRRLMVEVVPLDRLIDRIRPGVDLVAVSAVQSADGRRIDLDSLAQQARAVGTRTYLDVTQAAGWMPMDVSAFDVTACGAYKWLCCPRGSGFMTVTPEAREWVVPRHANWYAGTDPWTSIYGPPLRLASDARRYDASPAWITWVGAAPTLELLAGTGPAAIQDHDVGLANQFRDRLDLPRTDSPIVAIDASDGADCFTRAGVRVAGRAGRVRLSFHLYNTSEDVDIALAALRT